MDRSKILLKTQIKANCKLYTNKFKCKKEKIKRVN